MDEIPSNCILSKKIPGCGATTLELETDRNSIIVVPNVPVIIGKCNKYNNLLGVYEGVKQDKIVTYINNNYTYKIMTTPESFDKVKSACEKCGVNIYADFFLLMDECHQLVKDTDYRPDIVLPMNDFFNFDNKALVSATPMEFSDPRFKENNFDIINIEADYDYRQDITVTHTYNLAKAVGKYLENHNGTICFFINSVTIIYSIIKQFNLFNGSTIYCAHKSKGNLKKEYDFTNAYTEWSAETMRKYNFFTGRFFTAFDLELEYKPDLVMISDPFNAEFSMLDVDTDCIQICGRFRHGINSATHIFRVNPEIVVKSREQIEWEISAHKHAYTIVNKLYHDADCRESRWAFGEALKSLPFRKFQYPDFTTNWFAIDNEIDEVLVHNKYQSKISINKWYNDSHFFNPTFTKCNYNENDEKLKIIRSARSVKDKRKKIVTQLSEIEEPYSEYALDFINEARKIDPFIVEAYEVLGKNRIEELKYNKKKLSEDMILLQRKGNRVVKLVKNRFNVGGKYANETIVKEMKRIYELTNIHPEKEITPKIILDYFQAVNCWIGKKKGYMLISELI
jgi:hypothetical protein